MVDANLGVDGPYQLLHATAGDDGAGRLARGTLGETGTDCDVLVQDLTLLPSSGRHVRDRVVNLAAVVGADHTVRTEGDIHHVGGNHQRRVDRLLGGPHTHLGEHRTGNLDPDHIVVAAALLIVELGGLGDEHRAAAELVGHPHEFQVIPGGDKPNQIIIVHVIDEFQLLVTLGVGTRA